VVVVAVVAAVVVVAVVSVQVVVLALGWVLRPGRSVAQTWSAS
jgi:hypothetical protein